MKPAVVDAEFVMARVSKQANGCWHWTGSVNKKSGRGVYNREYAYRLAYRVLVRPIPAGMQINHHCDNGLCVNPDHLYVGTQTENMRDAVSRKRLKPPAPQHGELVHNAYPDAVIDEIRQRYQRGEMQKDLASEFGMSIGCVRVWVSGGARERTPIPRSIGACGTRAGYAAHIRRSQSTCEACRAANTTYLRAYKAARRNVRSAAA